MNEQITETPNRISEVIIRSYSRKNRPTPEEEKSFEEHAISSGGSYKMLPCDDSDENIFASGPQSFFTWLKKDGRDPHILFNEMYQLFTNDDLVATVEKYYMEGDDLYVTVQFENGDKEDMSFSKWDNMNRFNELIVQFNEMGVEYELSDSTTKPFKVIYRPIDQPNSFYEKFYDIVHSNNLQYVVLPIYKKPSYDNR